MEQQHKDSTDELRVCGEGEDRPQHLQLPFAAPDCSIAFHRLSLCALFQTKLGALREQLADTTKELGQLKTEQAEAEVTVAVDSAKFSVYKNSAESQKVVAAQKLQEVSGSIHQ